MFRPPEEYEMTFVTASLVADEKPYEIISDSDFSIASENIKNTLPEVNSPDLKFFRMILASEHENKNGDYFSRSELIKAVKTPINKPCNIEHEVEENNSYLSYFGFNTNKNTIIGHMVGSAIATSDGTILSDSELRDIDKTEDPNRSKDELLHIVSSAVLYDFCFPETVTDITKKVEAGDIFVSMECYFVGYDFFIGDKIVKSTKSNCVQYTKDWKEGKKANGRRVSRVLKKVLFGGCGIVKNPANTASEFITASLNNELSKLEKRHNELHILFDITGMREIEEEHRSIASAIDKLKKQISLGG